MTGKKTKLTYRSGDLVFDVVNHLILVLILFSVAYPIIHVISSSISSANAVLTGKVRLLPVGITLDGYRAVFKDSRVLIGYTNSIFYAVFGTCINVILTLMAAYPLSRKDFRGRNFLMFLFVFTMLFSGGLIPNYLLIRSLGLYNTRWAILLPSAVSAFNVVITRTFFLQTIPDELFESSRLDGCSNTRFFIKIVLPLSKAIIAVNVLFYMVFHWNSYFQALIFLSSSELFPLQLVLRSLLLQTQEISQMIDLEGYSEGQGLAELLRYCLIVVSSLPVMLIYPFVQKHFVKGLMIGSLKG